MTAGLRFVKFRSTIKEAPADRALYRNRDIEWNFCTESGTTTDKLLDGIFHRSMACKSDHMNPNRDTIAEVCLYSGNLPEANRYL